MEIRFISSMTPEDEVHLATVLVELVGGLLDQVPLAYTLQVETTAGRTVQRTHATLRDKDRPDDGSKAP